MSGAVGVWLVLIFLGALVDLIKGGGGSKLKLCGRAQGRALISVVIASYNAAKTLDQAIESILANAYQYVDILVIDGGSKDRTIDILRKHDKKLAYWESAPDNGIYHALNKGLTHAADGSYVLILGADDKLLNLADVVEVINRYDPDVIITDVRQREITTDFVRRYRCYLPEKVDEENFLNFPFHHQGFLFRKSAESLPYFDPCLGLHADYAFMARLVNSGSRSVYVEAELAEYMTGGASDYLSIKNLRSLWAVASSLGFSQLKILLNKPFAVMRMLAKVVMGKRLIMCYRAIFSRRHKNRVT